MASTGWQIEINRMLAAFSRQGTHSLSVIKAAFRQSGLSFTPQFKQHFLQVSINRIKETYEQFELNSMFEDQLKASLNGNVSTAVLGEAGQDSMSIQPSDHLNDEACNQLNTVVHVSTLRTEETMGEIEVNSEPDDNISGDESNASSANTFETVIEINDSDEEEAEVESKMEPANETTSGHTSMVNVPSTNEIENGHILIVNPSTSSVIDSNASLVVTGESGINQMLLQNDESNGSKSHENLGVNLNKSSVFTTEASNKPTGNVHTENDLANVGSVDRLDTSNFSHSNNAYNQTRPPKRKSSHKFIALSQAKVPNMSKDSHDVSSTNGSKTSGQIKNGESRVNGDTKAKDGVEPTEEEMNGQPRLKSCLVEGTRLKKKIKKKRVCFIGVPPPEKVVRFIKLHKTPSKVRLVKHTIDTM